MKTIPRYWGYARTATGCLLWRSSPNNQAEADEEARKAAERVSRYEKAKRRSERPQSEDYPYGVTLREKLLEEINGSQGRLQGFITRNQAGAEVLNVRNVLFLDWDTPETFVPPSGCLTVFFVWIGRLFGGKSESEEESRAFDLKPNDPLRLNPKTGFVYPKSDEKWNARTPEPWEERYPWAAVPELAMFMSHIVAMPDWSVRIYRTAAGYRGIATHALFDPTDPETLELMKRFECDPRYVLLCKRQESFRARLTPKGWRCGLWPDILPTRFRFQYPYKFTFLGDTGDLNRELWHPDFTPQWRKKGWFGGRREESPRRTDEEIIDEAIRIYQKEYEESVKLYEKASAPFATCRYLGTVGSEFIHPDIKPILDLHDEVTKALNREELTLA